MSEHPNAAKILALGDAIAGGNLEAVLDLYTDDALYRVGGHNLVSGNYRGREAMRAFFYHLLEVTGGTMRITIEDAIGADSHAVMFWRLEAQRNGKSIDARGAMAFKVDDDGKFTESWFLYEDQREYDEFYS